MLIDHNRLTYLFSLLACQRCGLANIFFLFSHNNLVYANSGALRLFDRYLMVRKRLFY